MTNPEQPVIDAIDALERDEIDDLVEQQLAKGIRSGEYHPHRPPLPLPAVVPPRPPIGLPPPSPLGETPTMAALRAEMNAYVEAVMPLVRVFTRQLQGIAAALRPRPAPALPPSAPETRDDTESDRQK